MQGYNCWGWYKTVQANKVLNNSCITIRYVAVLLCRRQSPVISFFFRLALLSFLESCSTYSPATLFIYPKQWAPYFLWRAQRFQFFSGGKLLSKPITPMIFVCSVRYDGKPRCHPCHYKVSHSILNRSIHSCAVYSFDSSVPILNKTCVILTNLL